MTPSMHRTAPRLLRAAAVTAAGVLLACVLAAATAPVASAGDCTGRFCGAVNNKTGRTMSITLDLGEGKASDCDVWNSNGGSQWDFEDAACIQEGWGNGWKGGNGTGADVDAFSFNAQGYHIRFYKFGKWRWRKQGLWTKVQDGQYADCLSDADGAIWCTVYWQLR